LFDWRGTLVHDPPPEWWVGAALAGVGRSGDDVNRWCEALRIAYELPEVQAGELICDTDADVHRRTQLRYFEVAGLDEELAACLYQLDFEPASHPFYPDTEQALRALHESGRKIALVSDFHVDVRPEFVAAGLDQYMDAYVISFEHGVQKPDPRMFEIALDALGVQPHEALMVGDRASHDGGAVALGITTLLVSPPTDVREGNGLDRVLALCR
jgi:HAD superfamily hydrolase (TIGR01509 family)